MKEEWRDIKEYKGYYQVSNLGRVKSLCRNIIMCQVCKPKGYKYVQLQVNGKCLTIGVHRLVAMAFIPNPNNKPQVDHIDGNPSNNVVTNLRWATQVENMNNPITKERMSKALSGENNPFFSRTHTEETKQILSKLAKQRTGKRNSFFGKKHSDETKKKISEYRKSKGIKISQYTKDGQYIQDWSAAAVAGRELKISSSSIIECCRGKRKTIGGYVWHYAEH